MSTNETQIIFGLHSSLAAILNKKRKIKKKIVCTEEVYRKNKELFESFKKIEKKDSK